MQLLHVLRESPAQAQFFPDLLNFCRRSVDVDKKVVFVAGLDGDYRREKFGDVRAPAISNISGAVAR